jgi:hypothetical protein
MGKKWFGHTHFHDVELQLGAETASAWPEKSDKIVSTANIDICEESNEHGWVMPVGWPRGWRGVTEK